MVSDMPFSLSTLGAATSFSRIAVVFELSSDSVLTCFSFFVWSFSFYIRFLIFFQPILSKGLSCQGNFLMTDSVFGIFIVLF